MPTHIAASLCSLVLLGAACASSPPAAPVTAATSLPASPAVTASPGAEAGSEVPLHVRSAVEAPDRTAEDRALDGGRRPAELLAFAGVAPGWRVAELQAGGGYTAELLARAVGSEGRVFGQNSAFVLQRFAEKPWRERLARPANANVVRVDRELDDPLPAEARGLDAVFMVLFYHDAVWQKVDRARMNAAIFQALRPGGVFIVVDHSARPSTGVADTETLHRIDETVVKDEVQRAGFKLAGEADFLRNPQDARDWNASPRVAAERRGTSDRFVLKFVRP